MGGRVCPREKTSEGKEVKRRKVHGDTHTHKHHDDTTFREAGNMREK